METISLDSVMILNITLVLEAFLLLIATVWSQFADIKLLTEFRLTTRNVLIGVGAGLLMNVVSFLIIWLGKFTKGWLKWLSALRGIVYQQVAPIFTDLNWFDIVLIALTSGFCEEVFFRGVVQAQLGIVATSILFGFFHCPSLKHLSYGIWAFFAGLFLGWLLIYSHSLWTPISAHAVNNLISLLYLRYWIKNEAIT
jgi:membrane protease YdiL (CAAX protease family)